MFESFTTAKSTLALGLVDNIMLSYMKQTCLQLYLTVLLNLEKMLIHILRGISRLQILKFQILHLWHFLINDYYSWDISDGLL